MPQRAGPGSKLRAGVVQVTDRVEIAGSDAATPDVGPVIELRHVSKRYGDGAPVLDDVCLRLDRGDYVVIIGRSGSGKSTLLNLLGALDAPSAGQVYFRGEALGALDETGRSLLRRRDIGFVFQAFNLVPTLTVTENLLVPLQLNGRGGPAARQRCDELLGRAGLEGLGQRFPDQLSGGEQQRVAVLRAIIHEPRVLIADEPTGNLDLETARRTLALLEDVGRRGDRVLIMATHSPEVMGRAGRCLTIRDGHVVDAPSAAGAAS